MDMTDEEFIKHSNQMHIEETFGVSSDEQDRLEAEWDALAKEQEQKQNKKDNDGG